MRTLKKHFTTKFFFLFIPSYKWNLPEYFSGFAKNHSYISALGCLETVANRKGVHLEKKATLKIFSSKINFQLAKFTF